MSVNSVCPLFLTGLFVNFISIPSYGGDVTCKAEVSNFDFGNIITGQTLSKQSVSGHVKLSCINRDSAPQYVNMCVNGPAPSWIVKGESSQEKGYSILFRDRTTGLPWGIDNSPVRVSRVIHAYKEITETIPVSAEMIIDPFSVKTGLLDLIFTLKSPSFSWYASSIKYGDSCPAPRLAEEISFSVRANIPKRCDVTADSLDFGKIVVFSSTSILSQSMINIKCTNETNYSVSLRSLNAGNTEFIMKNSANNKLTYTLYKDAARTDVWAAGGNEKIDRGTGKWQKHSVYGLVNILPSDSPASGDYTDTVIISVGY
ncbi:hypothetical protein EAG21025_42810 (plasmid) [Enterobacter asburiae]|uniref:Csu type fimbrial protein n=1 Tax=Enterobacter asburiae TaxID=61645 RepID=UPI0034E87E73|nr:spore coat U domain-containing protein [Enterobacter asburiae]